MNNKILVINKPLNYTSNDIVQIVKKIIKAKKVGHGGTLDPNASGVLILGINEGTKLLSQLILNDKEYIATIRFGISTNTFDATGIINKIDNSVIISKKNIIKVLDYFKNNIYLQTPPNFSAIKINGKKAYDLARENQEVNIKPREVKLYSWQILDFKDNRLVLKILVSKGFYVRSLCVDLASKLNTIAYLSDLIRTKSGNYSLQEGLELNQVYDYWIKQQNN